MPSRGWAGSMPEGATRAARARGEAADLVDARAVVAAIAIAEEALRHEEHGLRAVHRFQRRQHLAQSVERPVARLPYLRRDRERLVANLVLARLTFARRPS